MSFVDIANLIKKDWHPEAFPTELKYRESLTAFLRDQLKNATIEAEYRHLGTTIDIYIKKPGFFKATEVLIELKRNLVQKAQLDRLLGQLASLRPGDNNVLVVLCGESDPALLGRLREHYANLLYLGFHFAVMLKESTAKSAA